MTTLLYYGVQLLCLIKLASAHSTGAPAQACSDIYPFGHVAPSQNLRTNPFKLNISEFDISNGGTRYYVPSRNYTLTLSGSGGEQFKGFLVQARTVADGCPVGVFTYNSADVRISSCSPPESAVTHSTPNNKTSVSLKWTAPPEGSGNMHILFAVVTEFDANNGTSIFWATVVSEKIFECVPPLYLNGNQCVETCPLLHIGSHKTGRCEPFSSSYILSLNATRYYANLTSETPLNTTTFYLRLSINRSAVQEMDMHRINFGFNQNQLVQRLFEFENGEGSSYSGLSDLQIGSDELVVETALILVQLPAADEYPVSVDMTITVTLFHKCGSATMFCANDTYARGMAQIVMVPGPCDTTDICKNGGSCVITNNSHFTCVCPSSFTGQFCDEVQNPCMSYNPCGNGTCIAMSSFEYICNCPASYTGQNCSDPTLTCTLGSCSNGVCSMEAEGVSICICNPGYTGEFCDERILDCNSSQIQCNGHGNYTTLGNRSYCECNPGWIGDWCQVSIDSCNINPCANNGTCLKTNETDFICLCIPGWTGDWCQVSIDSCNINPCANNGTCLKTNKTDFICLCIPGWTGATCYSQISPCEPNPCKNNGTCVSNCTATGACSKQEHTCICQGGYAGDTCEDDDIKAKFCEQGSCANSGMCLEEYGPDISCVCTASFTGQKCETKVDICSCETVLERQIVYTIIGVMAVTVIALLVTLVLVLQYISKIKAKYNLNQQPSINGHGDYHQRSFSNTDSTGIYFEINRTTALSDSYRSNGHASLLSQHTQSSVVGVSDYEQPISTLNRSLQPSDVFNNLSSTSGPYATIH